MLMRSYLTSLQQRSIDSNSVKKRDMEQNQPQISRRSGSFNPEAPTFSPTTAETSMFTGPSGPTPPTSPRQKAKMSDTFDGKSSTASYSPHKTDLCAEDSPFRPARDMRPNYQGYEEVNAVRMPRKLPNQKDMPLNSLQEMLRYHHLALNQDQPSADFRSNFSEESSNFAMAYAANSPFFTRRHRSDSNAPGVDELSAGLGLPSIQKRVTNVDSPTRSHKSRGSEVLPQDLFAQYMDGKSVLLDDVVNTPRGLKGDGRDMYSVERAGVERQPTRLVSPPPGFTGERPRRVFAEEHSSVNPVATESPVRQTPTGPAGLRQLRRISDLNSVNHAQYHGHIRGPSRHYRPRALPRVKRTDQGPEPSDADIYPDDANFIPRRPPYQPESAGSLPSYIMDMPSTRQVHAEDIMVWPTPAEVYRQKLGSSPRRSVFARNAPLTQNGAPEHWSPPAASSMSQYMLQFGEPSHPLALRFSPPAPSPSPPFDIFAGHYPPTYADIHEIDAEMECLLAILPDIFDLDLPELPCDERPLTPGQTDGSRYGMQFHGIGLGDRWNCPSVREGEPFRVRPRDHDGWGGWQWAIDKGWGNE
ncbi:hypothetical protein GT037_002383 [Alternaria burnsii]|uniref:Uncharacterized protein n=1 Tax=Alternaria burnsii TaxID=1187904 RepID=A0A8H7EM34_9PLEO|nr:uncharacterized protein GT037_002383 [Alternaria burnsii]KAF7680732.1 hypothetical protein GT037_002383 [Alternaria burnsii]